MSDEEKKKQLSTELNKWRAAFVKANSREPAAEDIGADASIAQVYAEYNKLPGSSADHTVESLGMAVKLE